MIKNLSEIELVALLSASAGLRKEKDFIKILNLSLAKKVSHKKMYEALLQTYLFAGFPIALIYLKMFNKIVLKEKRYDGYDLHKYLSRGKKNCKIIYRNKYDKLISNVKSFSPELADWLIVEGYGKVLGRKGLSLKEREICNVSILSALKFDDQLYSHINGAFNCKVDPGLLKKVIENLSEISANNSAKFGLSVLNKYLSNRVTSLRKN